MKKIYPKQPSEASARILTIRSLCVREEIHPKHVNRPQGLEGCLLMTFHDPADLFYDGAIRTVKPGTTIIWSPFKKHCFGNMTRNWSHTWMYFSGTTTEKWLQTRELTFNRPLPFNAEHLSLKYVGMIYDELVANAPANVSILTCFFEAFRQELIRASSPKSSRIIPGPLLKVNQYIENNLNRAISLEELATAACQSPSHLNSVFRKWFGVSPVRYVIDLRMRRAAIQLMDMNQTIAEVAYSLGYDDPLYFSKRFRKEFGRSPTEHRQRSTDEPEPSVVKRKTKSRVKHSAIL